MADKSLSPYGGSYEDKAVPFFVAAGVSRRIFVN